MKNFALIENGVVTNVILWDGDVESWSPPTGTKAVELADDVPAGIGFSYDGSTFTAPPAPPAPPPLPPTADQVLAQRDALLAVATLRLAPLQDAADLDEATAVETAALKSWKQYRVALNRIESAKGFPASMAWPVVPA